VPDAAVPLGRDLRHGAAVAQILPDRVAVARFRQRIVGPAVGLLPAGHAQCHGQAETFGQWLDALAIALPNQLGHVKRTRPLARPVTEQLQEGCGLSVVK
jgi:hypothetical protein